MSDETKPGATKFAPPPPRTVQNDALTRRMRLQGPPVLAVLFFAALAVALFAPVLGSSRFLTWDVPEQYWPDLQYLCGSLWSLELPLWNPFDRGGYPFHADPQSGLYYPLNWALCAVGGSAPSLGFAEFRAAFHFALAGSLMCGFLRAMGMNWGASIAGGVAFMTAPYQRKMWEVNTAYTIAWLPGLWWAIERLVQLPNGRRAAILALVGAVTVTVGSPPSLYHTAVAAGVYALVSGFARQRSAIPYLLLAALLTVTMSAVLLWPAWDLMRASVQEGTDYASISAGGYHLGDLVELVKPAQSYLYIGAPVLLLAAWGAVGAREVPRSARVLFVLLAAYGVLMSLGDHTPVFRALFHVMPGVRAFRAPVRYTALAGASLAALAGLGADYLPKSKYTSFAAAALVLGSVWIALPTDRNAHAGPIPGAVATYRAYAQRAEGLGTSWRYYDEFGVGLRSGTRVGAREFRGYQDPLQLARFSRVLGKLHEFPRVLEQYNVRYLLRGPHFLHATSHHFLPPALDATFADDRGGGLFETREPLPAAYWVPQGVVVPSGDDALWRLRRTAPAAIALFEDDQEDGDVPLTQPAGTEREITPAQTQPHDGAQPSDPAHMRAASTVRVHRNSVDVTIETPGAGWLVVNEVFYPGWRAWVDGNETLVRRANFLMRAVEIPGAGRHEVQLRYAPGAMPWLGGAALVGLLLSLWLATRRDQ